MTEYYNSVVKALNGTIDGVNAIFTTDTAYVPGTIRVILNGQVYEPDDTDYGWTEIDDTTIQLTNAPLPDDILQAFYQDKGSEHLGLDSVVGSPFHPTGLLP